MSTNDVETENADDITGEMEVALDNLKMDDDFNDLAMETISELFNDIVNYNNMNNDVNPTTESTSKVIEDSMNELEMFVDSYEEIEAGHHGDGVDGESSQENYVPRAIDAESDETEENREQVPVDPEMEIEMLTEGERQTLDEISDLYEARDARINPLLGLIERDAVDEHEREYEEIPQYMNEENLMEIYGTYDMPATVGHFNGDLHYPCGESNCVGITEGNELGVRNEAISREGLLAPEVCNEEPSNPSLDSLLENTTLLGRDIENAGDGGTGEHMDGGATTVTVVLTGDGGQVVQQAGEGTSGLESILKIPVCIEGVGAAMLDLAVEKDEDEKKEEEQIPTGSAVWTEPEIPAGPNEETLEMKDADRRAAEQLNTEINEEYVWEVDDDKWNFLQQLAQEAGVPGQDMTTESSDPARSAGESVTCSNDSEWTSLLQLAREAGIRVQF